jgi:hypothetical protein
MTHPVLARLVPEKKSLLIAAVLLVIAGPIAVVLARGGAKPGEANAVEMKRYQSTKWRFELDVPAQWTVMPPMPTESRAEVVRFWSYANGNEGMIIFRRAYDPQQQSQEEFVRQAQQVLANGGPSRFVTGETTLGSRRALTLDWTEATPDGGVMSYREYFLFDGPMMYRLRFGTPEGEPTLRLFERVAKSFSFESL